MPGLFALELARRGFEVARQAAPDGRNDREKADGPDALTIAKAFGIWGVMIVAFLFFAIFPVLLEYTLRFVVGTLAAVEHIPDESPSNFELDGLLAEDEDEDGVAEGSGKAHDGGDDDNNDDNDAKSKVPGELNDGEDGVLGERDGLAKTPPITSSILGTLRHLRRQRGFWSLFRGFSRGVVWGFASAMVQMMLDSTLGIDPWWLSHSFSFTLSLVVTAPLHCSWTHAIIRRGLAPRADGLARYTPGVWSRHLILPTLRFGVLYSFFIGCAFVITKSVAQQLPKGLPVAVFALLGLIAPFAFMAVGGVLWLIPAIIALTRVEASLMPAGTNAVVPFDPSFGGRSVTWTSTDSRWNYVWVNAVAMGSWKTFDKETYWRVLKVYAKFGALQLVITTPIILAMIQTFSRDMQAIFQALEIG